MITYKYEKSSVELADMGDYNCEIKKENRWNVYFDPQQVEISSKSKKTKMKVLQLSELLIKRAKSTLNQQ